MKNARPQTTEASAQSKRNFSKINDLFPESLPQAVPAVWPKRGTRDYEALQAFIKAPQNQADYWPGWRLAAYVQSLEYDGWAFIARWIKHSGCRGLIKEYTLDRTDPSTAAALEAGSVFYVQ